VEDVKSLKVFSKPIKIPLIMEQKEAKGMRVELFLIMDCPSDGIMEEVSISVAVTGGAVVVEDGTVSL
jgi:hypothetical protein